MKLSAASSVDSAPTCRTATGRSTSASASGGIRNADVKGMSPLTASSAMSSASPSSASATQPETGRRPATTRLGRRGLEPDDLQAPRERLHGELARLVHRRPEDDLVLVALLDPLGLEDAVGDGADLDQRALDG